MQAADHAAGDEERERDDHAAGAAADGVERAGAAAVGELHADAEHERADQQRRPERRDRAAEARAPALATGTIAAAAMAISSKPPRKPSAWPRTISRRHDAVKLNSALRNTTPSAKPSTISAAAAGWPSIRTSAISTRGGQHRRDQERPVETRQRAPQHGLRWQQCSWLCQLMIGPAARLKSRSRAPSSHRPSGCATRRPDGAHRRSIRPSSRHRAARRAGRASPTARTSWSPPSGRCCSRRRPDRPAASLAIAASSSFERSRLVAGS